MHYTSRSVYEHISIITNDPIVEWKICAISGTEFAIYQSDLDFYTKISPTFDGQRFLIPTPTLCPEERQRRRLSFRNERKLYKRRCDATGEQIISIYSPDKPYKIYNQQYRWSDARDATDYGFDFNFSKTFAENFKELLVEVPRPNLLITSCENCEYTNHSYYNKNCYLLFGALFNEDCLFSDQMANSTNCLECRVGEKMDNCFWCLTCFGCSNLFYSISCEQCMFSYGLYNCTDCHFCINSSNVNHKKYRINNQQSTKEEYDNYIISGKFTSPNVDVSSKIINSENSVGNEIHGSNNCVFCFDIYNCVGCKYIWSDMDAIDAMDSYGITNSPLSIECLAVKNLNKSLGNLMCIGGEQIYYSQLCNDCSHCFGCIGLRNKQHYIFNKQYSKEEYEIQVAKIITHMISTGEWGEFFHPSLSPFGYNETVAQEYYPIQESELSEFGYRRSTYSSDPKIPGGVTTLTGDQIPADITAVTDDILKQVIICEVSRRPFMIQRAELEFYRKHSIRLPRKHPDIRHEERMKLRPERTLYLRNCDNCDKEMLSVYPQEHEGQVYCETCYQKEVFS